MSAVVQGGLIRRLVPRFGEPKLIAVGLVVAACGFAGMALAKTAPELAGSMLVLAIGQGLLSPSVSGLISRMTPMSKQGAVFGTLTSAQTLARMLSYSTSNVLLGKVALAAPYWGAFGIDVLAFAVASHSAIRFVPEKPNGADAADIRATEEVGVDLDP